MKAVVAKDVDEYISGFPKDIQQLLKELRTTVKKAAPGAEEYIGYQMPAYKYHGPLVYFGGYNKHIGFYPTASGIESFKKELSVYKSSRGAVQFPLDKPLPLALIKKIVQFRMKENLMRAELKAKTKKAR